MKKENRFLSVDMQNDFCSVGGFCYNKRASVKFVINEILPELDSHGIKVSEIISDYRQPRCLDDFELCVPGTWGYASVIDDHYKYGSSWVKAHNSPVWIREQNRIVQRCNKFDEWLIQQKISPVNSVFIFGLTLDCCILCVAQELYFRGIQPYIIIEGTDVYSGDLSEKARFLEMDFWKNWAKTINWIELKKLVFS